MGLPHGLLNPRFYCLTLPVPEVTIDGPHVVWAPSVGGEYLFLPSMQGMLVFEASTGTFLGISRQAAGRSAFTRGNHVFVATSRGMSVFSANPGSVLKPVASVDVGAPQNDVVVSGNHAYLLDDGVNLRVFDVSKAEAPNQVAYYSSTRYPSKPISASDAPAFAGNSGRTNQLGAGLALHSIANEPPQLVRPMKHADGSFGFVLVGVPSARYFIEASTNLSSWVAIATNSLPEHGILEINDAEAGAFPQRHYRAIMVP